MGVSPNPSGTYFLPVLKAGVQRAPPFGRGLGVSPNPSSYFLGPQSGSPQMPFGALLGRGLGVSPSPSSYFLGSSKRESRGRQPFGRGLGVSPNPSSYFLGSSKRESRGRRPLRPGGAGGVLPAAGVQARASMVRALSYFLVLKAGVQRAAALWQGWGCPPTLLRTSSVLKAGVQRAPPFGRRYGGCASINGSTFLLRAASKAGVPPLAGVYRGMVRATFETRLLLLRRGRSEWECVARPRAQSGSPEGGPLAGVWGCPPALLRTSWSSKRESRGVWGAPPLAGGMEDVPP